MLFIYLFIAAHRLISGGGGINTTSVVCLVIIMLSPVIVFMSSFGHLSLLKSPVFASRTLISFSGVLFYLAYVSHQVLVTVHREDVDNNSSGSG